MVSFDKRNFQRKWQCHGIPCPLCLPYGNQQQPYPVKNSSGFSCSMCYLRASIGSNSAESLKPPEDKGTEAYPQTPWNHLLRESCKRKRDCRPYASALWREHLSMPRLPTPDGEQLGNASAVQSRSLILFCYMPPVRTVCLSCPANLIFS